MWILFKDDHSGPHPVQMVFCASPLCESNLKVTYLDHILSKLFSVLSPRCESNLKMTTLDYILSRWVSVHPHNVNPIWNYHSGPHPVHMVFGGSPQWESYLKWPLWTASCPDGMWCPVQMVFGASPLCTTVDHVLFKWFSVAPHHVNPIKKWSLWTTSCPDGFRCLPTMWVESKNDHSGPHPVQLVFGGSPQCGSNVGLTRAMSYLSAWYHLSVFLAASRCYFWIHLMIVLLSLRVCLGIVLGPFLCRMVLSSSKIHFSIIWRISRSFCNIRGSSSHHMEIIFVFSWCHFGIIWKSFWVHLRNMLVSSGSRFVFM